MYNFNNFNSEFYILNPTQLILLCSSQQIKFILEVINYRQKSGGGGAVLFALELPLIYNDQK